MEVIQKSDSNFVNVLLERADTSSSSPEILQYLLKAQNYLEKENRPLALFEVYRRIGKIYQSEDLDNRALPIYQKALALPSPPILESQKLKLSESIAEAYFNLEKVDSALLVYEEQLAFFRKEKNHDGILRTLQRQVNVFLKIKNYRRALDLNLQIKLLVEAQGDQLQLAIINNNLGYNHNYLKEYKEAVDYFSLALKIYLNDLVKVQSSKKVDANFNLAVLYTNLGVAYNNLNKPEDAISYLLQAQKSNDAKVSGISNAYIQHLVATIYYNYGDMYNALKFNDVAMGNAKKNKEAWVLSETYNTAAKIQQKLFDYELALEFYQKHFRLRDSFALEDRFRKQQLLQQQLLIEKSEKEIRLMLVNEAVKDQEIATLQFQTKYLASESEKISLEAEQQRQELLLLKSEQDINDANLRNASLEAQKAQQELVLTQQRLLTEEQNQAIKEAKQQKELAQLEIEKSKAEKNEAEQKIELYKKNEDLAQLKLEQEQSFRQFVYGLGALLGLVFIMILSAWYYARVANRRLENKNKEIELERQKSENLLLNILPLETANELKATGFATPKEYEKVTVLFCDFSNFTKISEKLTAEELIHELNECFRALDDITVKFNLEKIKTIGDGYMCAGGIPVANESNPTDAVRAALEMQNFMKRRFEEKKEAGIPYWNMRIGIHTGHVIAGVVGTKKFAYDIWGDTVNIASRMESSCENGKINISARTRELVNGEFDCTYRGEVEVKHGNEVGMYFVERGANLL